MKRWLALAVVGASAVTSAQTLTQGRRADGAMTPLMVYGNAMTGGACTPVVVFSHGAGGSERGYVYQAQGLAERGWYVIVPGHRESGALVAQSDIEAEGSRQAGLYELVTNGSAYAARLQDVGAALDYARAHCTAKKQPWRALAGHSMGGETVMLEAGARNIIHLPAPPAGQDRFDAYVAESPEGPGVVFPEGAWKGIHKPMFVFTGTLDGAMNGGPETRLLSYAGLPGDAGCDWLGVIDGATHKTFGGRGPDQEKRSPLVVGAVDAFLRGAMTGHCVLPPAQPGITLRNK